MRKRRLCSPETKAKISKALTGIKRSLETCEKISKAKLGKPNLKLRGRKYSKELCLKLSKAHQGQKPITCQQPWTEEHRANASKAQKKRAETNKVSAGTRKKLSKAAKGRIVTVETRKKISMGNTGHSPSLEVRQKISKSVLKQMGAQAYQPPSYGLVRGGKRDDLSDVYFRSGWEANMARYFNFFKIKWEHEFKTYWFPITHGTISYTPDFYLPENDEIIEVKGRLSSKCKTKLRRFRKYFLDDFRKLKVVVADPFGKSKLAKKTRSFFVVDIKMPIENLISYSEINKKYKNIIPNWE